MYSLMQTNVGLSTIIIDVEHINTYYMIRINKPGKIETCANGICRRKSEKSRIAYVWKALFKHDLAVMFNQGGGGDER